jgi:hypothetical protein
MNNFLLNLKNNTENISPKMNNNIITFVTCWYNFKSKFSPKKYMLWINNLLSIVNNFNLVIYTDLASVQMLLSFVKNDKIKIIIKPINHFVTYKYKDNWIKNHTTSDMLLHKVTDWQLNMLWNEKIFFVKDAFRNKYFNSLYYGWCDIGYFRNGYDDLNTSYLHHWPNHFKIMSLKKNFIHYGQVQNNEKNIEELEEDIKSHYSYGLKTQPTNKYDEISFAGGFFILSNEMVEKYAYLYDKKLEYYFTNNYFIKDDQMIVMDIIFTNPNLFDIHREQNPKYNNWFMFQRLLL